MFGGKYGGPAFPLDEKNSDGTHWESHPGMTLRDYFAAKALPAIMMAASAGQHTPGVSRGIAPSHTIEVEMALDAYAVADAMILARDK